MSVLRASQDSAPLHQRMSTAEPATRVRGRVQHRAASVAADPAGVVSDNIGDKIKSLEATFLIDYSVN